MLNPCAEVFVPNSNKQNFKVATYEINKLRHDHIRPCLNINAKIFVPRLLVLSGIRIILAILIMIFNMFLVIIILVGKFRGATYCDVSPQKRLKLLKNNNPLKLIIGHLNSNSIRTVLIFVLYRRQSWMILFHKGNF